MCCQKPIAHIHPFHAQEDILEGKSKGFLTHKMERDAWDGKSCPVQYVAACLLGEL